MSSKAPLALIYDAEDEAIVDDGPWCLTNGYPSRRRNGRVEYLHVLIGGQEAGREIDHMNGNLLDVRRCNLRLVPHKINAQNLTRLQRNNTSGFRGVTFDRGKWKAAATIDGRSYHIGRFVSAAAAGEAASVYRRQHMEGALN